MTFIYFTNDEGTEIGIPLNQIKSLEFQPCDEDHDEDEFTVYMEDNEYYEVEGKSARKAWEEIKIQIKNANVLRNPQ